MTANANTVNPFDGVDPVAVLVTGESLDLTRLAPAVAWAESLAAAYPDAATTQPRAKISNLRGMTTSLVTLARDQHPAIVETYEDFVEAERVLPASLMLALELIIRARTTAPTQAVTDAQVAEVIARRGWNNIEACVDTLCALEVELVDHGDAALRKVPALAAKFAADDDKRTYDDAIGDIQRRLDFAATEPMKPWFDKAPKKTAELTTRAKALLVDANIYHQSRESRTASSARMTVLRNVVFTRLMVALAPLQAVLRPVVSANADLMKKVDASYWWNLDRLGKPAKGRTADGGNTEADAGTTADGAGTATTP